MTILEHLAFAEAALETDTSFAAHAAREHIRRARALIVQEPLPVERHGAILRPAMALLLRWLRFP